MTKVINIPIEPLEERYSLQWDRWFRNAFEEDTELDVLHVYGECTSGKINQGSFLDVVETNLYKTTQLERILTILSQYDDKEKLILFFHDLWFPGILNIAYLRDGLGLKNLRICGCLHAGSYDNFDFLNKKNMTPWASFFEHALGVIVDKVFVATRFHRDLLAHTRLQKQDIEVTGFPIFPTFLRKNIEPNEDRDPIIVFPHRLDSEKNPNLFYQLSKTPSLKNCIFVKSKEVTQNKREYYQLLQKSKFAVSFADQETWGIAMQEAVLCGCIPIVPDRLSYKEMYNNVFKFGSMAECVHLIETHLKKFPLASLHVQRNTILQDGKNAIPNILKQIKML